MKLGERSLEQIRNAIVGGGTFIYRLPSGGMIARYEAGKPVYVVTRHGIKELPQQGGDLCWLLTSLDEEGASLDPDVKRDAE